MNTHYTRNKAVNTLETLATLQMEMHVLFPKNFTHVLTVHRKIKENFVSEKA